MKFLEWLGEVLFPRKCIFCGRLLGKEVPYDICEPCQGELPYLEDNLIGMARIPNGCTEKSGELYSCCDSAVCVWSYTGRVKDSLIRFKFFGKPSSYRTYAWLLSEKVGRLVDVSNLDMTASVPLHRVKEQKRGYNQAYLISRAVGKRLGLHDCSYVLERCRNTDTQSLLDRSAREQNVKGAFRVTRPDLVKGKRILLIDDIITTGFTVNECGRVLKEAGAVSVIAAAVATGRGSNGEINIQAL